MKGSAKDFPNGLSADVPPAPLPRRWFLLIVLLLGCLIPRLWAAWRWDVLWADSVFYLNIAEALEQDNFDAAFRSLGLNVYPAILVGLRYIGGKDGLMFGESWSILMATLTVLPLFGWIRRQFDDQVAFLAGLLYAVHPKLVGYSPLIIRDPTYWFFFCLSLYLTWRAVTELRWWLFLSAGVALTLTVYLRTEGWLLLPTLVLWAFWRLPTVSERRWRLALGTAMCLAVIPVSVITVNLTWLKDHSRWELGQLEKLEATWAWLVSSTDRILVNPAYAGDRSDSSSKDTKPSPAPSLEKPSPFVVFRKTSIRLVKAFTYTYGVLILVGLYRWWRLFLRRDQQTLFLQNLLLFAAVYSCLSRSGQIDIRYFLTIILLGLPYVALGLFQMADWLQSLARRRSAPLPQRSPATAVALLAIVAILGLPDTILSAEPLMRQQADLGRWILQRQGADQVIVGPNTGLRLLAHYSHGRTDYLPRAFSGDAEQLMVAIRKIHPDVLLLWDDMRNRKPYELRGEVVERCLREGYYLVPPDQLPASCRDIQVILKSPKIEMIAQPLPHPALRRQ